MSFYLDNQIQENYVQYARQNDNLFQLSYMYGYKPRVTSLSTTDVDFYQVVPSVLSGSEYVPDYNYALYVNSNTKVSTRTGTPTNFSIENPIDFTVSSSTNPTTVSVAQITADVPSQFLLKKTARAFSGDIKNIQFTFGAPQEFATVNIVSNDIAGVLDIVDSDGNKWYEVNYLGEEQVYDSIKNTNINDPNNYATGNDSPYLLQTKAVQNRFATRFINDSTLQLQFGAGSPLSTTEEIIPNPSNVGIGLPFGQDKLTSAYSPTNFVFTNTYGVAPTNTTLTVRYYVGGGVSSNILSNTLTNPDTSTIQFNSYKQPNSGKWGK